MLRNPNPEFLPISHEDEFLPPLSKWTSLGGIFLVSTVAIAFVLSAFTPLPVTVKASAVVSPRGEVKLVQAPVEGTVVAINVKENQIVTQKTALVILDASHLNTRQAQLQSNLQHNSQQIGQVSEQLKNGSIPLMQ
jgi:multidrug efflux pump subunit AcrA (membrane-fusion protein)